MSRVTLISIGRVALLGCLLSVLPTSGSSQDAVWGGELVARIDSLAEATLRDGPVAGLTIGVKRGGDLLMVKGYGDADIENSVPMTAGTVYRIGSLTKQFTSAAVMQLVEAGLVSLDDAMTQYLPDYPTQGHEVSIRHLLTHTSGIKSYTSLGDAFWLKAGLLDLSHSEMLELFQNEPCVFAPGGAYRYNNTGYYLLGMII
jgi:D-alanyl-D-alanine carboxypeptidase